MDLFAKLEKKQKFTFFNAGAENRFFLARGRILTNRSSYKALSRAQKPFDIIRANIIIRALENKKTLDEACKEAYRQHHHADGMTEADRKAIVEAVEEAKKGLPYLAIGDDRIYVPILPRSFNHIYDKEILRLEDKQFKSLIGNGFDVMAVDPFDTYGSALFDSYFTNLILVRKHKGVAAFFDYDSLSIYFVNEQGRLDVKIALFDRYIGKRNTNHMMERIVPVVDAYFRDDREGLMHTLVQNQLVSSRLIYKISTDEKKRYSKVDRHFEI